MHTRSSTHTLNWFRTCWEEFKRTWRDTESVKMMTFMKDPFSVQIGNCTMWNIWWNYRLCGRGGEEEEVAAPFSHVFFLFTHRRWWWAEVMRFIDNGDLKRVLNSKLPNKLFVVDIRKKEQRSRVEMERRRAPAGILKRLTLEDVVKIFGNCH